MHIYIYKIIVFNQTKYLNYITIQAIRLVIRLGEILSKTGLADTDSRTIDECAWLMILAKLILPMALS